MSDSDAAQQIAAYLDISSATNPAWVSEGRIGFIADISGVPNVYISRPGAAATPLTSGSNRVGGLIVSPGGNQLIFAMDRGGDERHQLWLLDVASKQARPLTDDPDTIHQLGVVSPDGERLAFASNARDPLYFDVMTIQLDNSTAIPIPTLSRDEHLLPLAFSPDGAALLIRRDNTNLDADLLLMPSNGDAIRELTPHEGEASIPKAAFDPTGNAIWFVSNQDQDFLSLRRLDLASGDQHIVVEAPWDVETVAVAPRGDWLAYVINEDGSSRVRLRSTQSDEERQVRGLPDGVIDGLTWSPDGTRLAFTLSGPRHPSAIWHCGLDGVATAISKAEYGAISPASLREPRVVRYPSFDDQEIPAFWYHPEGSGPWPVVVDVHGGPESQRRTHFAPTTQFLLSRGYAVLAPNVRGSTGYGKAYCHLDDVERRMDAVADLAAAAGWLSAREDVVQGKIAVMGQSYGGFMTLAALTTYPELWAAGVDVVGIADFVTFLERTGPWRRSRRAAEYGDLERDAKLLHEISPLHKVDRIQAPLIVVHGRNDPRVPLYEAEQMVAALEALNRPTELLVFDDEGHGLVKRPNRIVGYGAIAAFLDQHLGGAT